MKGLINKLGVIFEPMGFNHFIDVPLHQLVKATITDFDYYGPTFWQMKTGEIINASIYELSKSDATSACNNANAEAGVTCVLDQN